MLIVVKYSKIQYDHKPAQYASDFHNIYWPWYNKIHYSSKLKDFFWTVWLKQHFTHLVHFKKCLNASSLTPILFLFLSDVTFNSWILVNIEFSICSVGVFFYHNKFQTQLGALWKPLIAFVGFQMFTYLSLSLPIIHLFLS